MSTILCRPLRIKDSQLRIKNYELRISDFRFGILDLELIYQPTLNLASKRSQLRIKNYELRRRKTGEGRPETGDGGDLGTKGLYQLRITNYELRIVNYELKITNYGDGRPETGEWSPLTFHLRLTAFLKTGEGRLRDEGT